jgi:DnaJ-class molecular chaperone
MKFLDFFRNATQIEIKKAFRKLSLEFHPDKAKSRGEDTNKIYQQII